MYKNNPRLSGLWTLYYPCAYTYLHGKTDIKTFNVVVQFIMENRNVLYCLQ